MAAAAASGRKRREREEEEEEKAGDDPLIAAVLQNNVGRFQQLWDQAVLASDQQPRTADALVQSTRLSRAVAVAIRASNVGLLQIMASTTKRYAVPELAMFTTDDIVVAIQENDLELVKFFYTVRFPPNPLPPPAPQAVDEKWPLFGAQLYQMPKRVDHFLKYARTDEMCELGAKIFGFLLLTKNSFQWLMTSWELKAPGQIAALLRHSAPWWLVQRDLVGPGVPILDAPGDGWDIATLDVIVQFVRDGVVKHMNSDSFTLYRQLISSDLWQAAEFSTPGTATANLKQVLQASRGADVYTTERAPLITEWAQYIIVQLGADWTWLFASDAVTIQSLTERREKLLEVLFDAVTVSYLTRLFVQSWESVIAQQFLRLAELLTEEPYIAERAAVLALQAAFPDYVAFGSNVHIADRLETSVMLLSRIYRRIALLLRDVTDVAPPPPGAFAAVQGPHLTLERRGRLLRLSAQLLARVVAAEPERLQLVQETLEQTAGLPQPVAEFISFLPYSQKHRRRWSGGKQEYHHVSRRRLSGLSQLRLDEYR